jgi:FMN phosphatase YigB (HAD superfamily)
VGTEAGSPRFKWTCGKGEVVAVSFDLFGTLVRQERPAEPWEAVAAELRTRDVPVPEDWEAAYRTSHTELEPGREQSLVTHVRAALASRGVDADRGAVRDALLDAFGGPVEVRSGATEALAAAREHGPVGVLSNCSLPGLVDRTLSRTQLAPETVVTSVGCGWRKPHDRAFGAVADRLGVGVEDLVHVGDDPRADGGGRTAGVTVVLTDDIPLSAFPEWLEGR